VIRVRSVGAESTSLPPVGPSFWQAVEIVGGVALGLGVIWLAATAYRPLIGDEETYERSEQDIHAHRTPQRQREVRQ